jgi:hypothetical protein
MPWQIQEGVNLGHTDSLWTVSNLYNVIACTNFSFQQHAKVESWSVMFYEQGCHPRFIHANADAVARHAWLRYFKFSATDAVSIADADFVIRKSLDGEIFSELAESKIVAAQKALPVMVRIHLVDEYSAVLPTVTRQIGLRIALNIESAHHSPFINWRFPDDVKKHAAAIYDRIRGIGGAVMPPPPPRGEGPWPQSRIELFAKWMADGFPP